MALNFEKQLDSSKAVDAKSVADSSTPWKDRIIEWMSSQPEAAQSVEAILKATDPKFTGDNLGKRKHCLDSQLTYMRQDYNIRTKSIDEDKIVLLGVQKGEKLIPFKNAVKYL